jgi:hypothetical protein
MNSLRRVLCLLLPMVLLCAVAVAQRSATALLGGDITDPSGLMVSGAEITLTDQSTNISQTTTTNDAGHYVFPALQPGQYRITVKKTGFRQVATTAKVDIGQSVALNLRLEVGAATEVVEVRTSGVELQTMDASVGSVIGADELANMPNLTRDATQLLLFQPGTIPAPGNTDENYGGQVMGARSDQNTFVLDGGDATNNTEGNGSYSAQFSSANVRATIPTPVESLEEFRVVTNNNTAGLGRSAGAEVQMVTKRGTNDWHGGLYEYYQSSQTNANAWDLNHDGVPRPELHDSRFGAKLGGPIIKNKTFFFVHYEGRRFVHGDTYSRLVPSQNLRNGLLGYLVPPPGGGPPTKVYIDPTTQDCAGNAATPPNTCDPLGLGINADVAAIWSKLPLSNTGHGDPNAGTGGDGVNFINYTGPIARTTNEDFGVIRLDHQISTNWHAMASYRYGLTARNISSGTGQVELTTNGFKSLSNAPNQPRYAVFGLTGTLSPHFTNDLRFDFLRNYWGWITSGAQPQLPGLGGALQIQGESYTAPVPVNVDTQQARQRIWNGKDWNLIDNVAWQKGNHLMQFGGHFLWQRLFHNRDDKVTYALNDPVYYLLRNSSHPMIGGIPLPPDTTIGKTNWRTAYASLMGMVEEANQVRARSADLSVLPPGTRIQANTSETGWELHWADAWRVTPSLSLTYGLTWGVQKPPYEAKGEQTLVVDAATNKPFTVAEYLNKKKAAALAGNAYNPTLGFMPIKMLGRKYPFDVDYGNVAPRFAAAWNPSITSGPLAWLFGDRKGVLRAGWTRVFDRLNGVDLVMTPALGIGFSDVASCQAPLAAGGCGGTTASSPSTAFRIGTNGDTIPIPDPPPITPPAIPGVAGFLGANIPYATRDYRIDPGRKVGSSDVYTLSIQRELPSRTLLEVGFTGRISRNLYQKVDPPSTVPYMFTKGGQTFANAFDALQTALIAGNTPGIQPFFEAALGGATSAYCTGYASCTDAVVANEGGNISIRDVSTTFQDLDTAWVTGPMLGYTNQLKGSDTTVSWGSASYASMYVSMRKMTTYGLGLNANYTLAKALSTYGWNQDIIDSLPDAYDPKRSYGPASFDVRHVGNAMVSWDLPFGRGKSFLKTGALERIFGGWGTSYLVTLYSGQPLYVVNYNSGNEYGDGIAYNDASPLIPLPGFSVNAKRHDSGVVIGPNGNGSNCGAGTFQGGYPCAFQNPDAVAAGFRLPLFSDSRAALNDRVRGLGGWTFDFGVSKTTHITEKLTTRFDLQMVNAFNHPLFFDPSMDISTASTFGVMDTPYNRPRYIQWGLRFDF